MEWSTTTAEIPEGTTLPEFGFTGFRPAQNEDPIAHALAVADLAPITEMMRQQIRDQFFRPSPFLNYLRSEESGFVSAGIMKFTFNPSEPEFIKELLD